MKKRIRKIKINKQKTKISKTKTKVNHKSATKCNKGEQNEIPGNENGNQNKHTTTTNTSHAKSKIHKTKRPIHPSL